MAVKIWNYRSWIAGFCTALFFTLYPTVAEKEAESKKWHREKEVLVNRMGELTEGMRKSYRFIGEALGLLSKCWRVLRILLYAYAVM